MFKYALTILFIGLLSSANASSNCQKIKAAFDIGSGATKLKVARVNTCNKTIEEVLLDTNIPVSYKEDLQKNSKFSVEVINNGVTAISTLMKKARELGASEFSGVTTSAARNAVNAEVLIAAINRKTNLSVKIISQQEEARLGFYAALSSIKIAKENLVVWDIGGGSMQISGHDGDKLEIYEGKMASVSFKDVIIREVQHKDVLSPNPISPKEYNMANLKAKEAASKARVPKIKGKKIVGIGGVHYYSIGGQLKLNNKDAYTLAQLSSLIPKRLNLTDEELKSEYARTEVSNLILVEGFMQAIGIDQVQILKINLCDGLLIQS